MAESAARTLGSYRIGARIASGGMGQVYQATATGPDGVQKPIAIKLIRDDLLRSRRVISMFVEEAKVAFLLTHPNIVQTYELGQVDGHYFLVMEHVSGISLEALLLHAQQHLGQPLPAAVALYIAARAARGLAYAHELRDQSGAPLGIVHRDVSPGNILLSDDGQVKLVDFGLAKSVLRRAESQAGDIKGKLAYMAPEQLRGEPVDARADIFALGITLFEMLAGANPFGDPGEVALSRRLEKATPPPLSQSAPHVEPPIPALVSRCLQPDPSGRFDTARDLGRELDRCVAELGLMLSDYDLADFITQAMTAATERASEAPIAADPFDRALGLELRKVAAEDGVGTFISTTTDRGAGGGAGPATAAALMGPEATPTAAAEPAATSSEPAALPRSGRPWLGMALVGGVIGAALLITWRASTPGDGASQSTAATAALSAPDRSSEDAVATPRPAARSTALPHGGRAAAANDARTAAPADAGSAPVDASVELDRAVAAVPLRRPLARRRRRPKPAPGLLSLNSAPWSIVYVDGKRLRSTPLVGHRLPAGVHVIRLVNPAQRLQRTLRLTIRSGQHLKRSVRLQQDDER